MPVSTWCASTSATVPSREHIDRLERVRAVAITVGKPIGVLADLPGPKVRAGEFVTPGVQLEAGSVIRFEIGDGPSDADVIHVDYAGFLDDLAVGDRVVIGDGAIVTRVQQLEPTSALAVVENGGRAQGCPGVHLPSERSRLATPTEEDLVLAETMASAGVEFIAVSFVRAPADMMAVREVVGDRAQLVAKIETSAALGNLTEILAVSDAIMVARGDLGIDCPLEDVPHLQKSIVRQCVEFGVPVITATQMLESMVTCPFTDPGRGQRRRQRRVRRHRRLDVVGRDRGRGQSGAGGGDDESHRGAGRSGGELPAMVGVAGPAPTRSLVLTGRPHHGRPHARRRAGGSRRRRGRDPVLYAQRSNRQGDGAGSGPRRS